MRLIKQIMCRPRVPLFPCFFSKCPQRQEAVEKEAAIRLAAGAGKGLEKSSSSSAVAAAGVGGVGMAHATGLGRQELEDAAGDERHLRKVRHETEASMRGQ